MRLKLGILIFSIAAVLFGIFLYVRSSTHSDIQKDEAAYTISTTAIKEEFENDVEIAASKYQNKVIILNGTVTGISDSGIFLDDMIFVTFLEGSANIQKDDEVTIKGRCIGYDELLGELKIDQAALLR